MTTLSKFYFDDINHSKKNKFQSIPYVKPQIHIQKNKLQEEFGPKKFIKP